MDRDQISQALCAIWAELLAVDVEPDDDFFELGGYSLLIVNVVANARKLGITMSPDQVFDYKTPGAIAAVLRPDGATPIAVQAPAAGTPTGPRDPDFDEVWATGLSPMQTRPVPSLAQLAVGGRGTPVFCFHWGAGNVRFVGEVVDGFRGDRPVFGLESVGMWSRERPALSVVETAARYLEEIRTEQPHGPYLLVGPCAGGRIAFEIARQLERSGETVAVLALVNAVPPGVNDLEAGWGPREFYEFRLAGLRQQFGVPNLNTDRERVIRDMIRASKLDEGMDPADLHWRQAVWAAGNFAQEHYEPRPYGGDAIVFQLAQMQDREEAQWSRMVAATEVHTFDTDDTLPLLHDSTFAEILRKKLAAFPG